MFVYFFFIWTSHAKYFVGQLLQLLLIGYKRLMVSYIIELLVSIGNYLLNSIKADKIIFFFLGKPYTVFLGMLSFIIIKLNSLSLTSSFHICPHSAGSIIVPILQVYEENCSGSKSCCCAGRQLLQVCLLLCRLRWTVLGGL